MITAASVRYEALCCLRHASAMAVHAAAILLDDAVSAADVVDAYYAVAFTCLTPDITVSAAAAPAQPHATLAAIRCYAAAMFSLFFAAMLQLMPPRCHFRCFSLTPSPPILPLRRLRCCRASIAMPRFRYYASLPIRCFFFAADAYFRHYSDICRCRHAMPRYAMMRHFRHDYAFVTLLLPPLITTIFCRYTPYCHAAITLR